MAAITVEYDDVFPAPSGMNRCATGPDKRWSGGAWKKEGRDLESAVQGEKKHRLLALDTFSIQKRKRS